jgi:Rrf2 family transcriptional regulator, iron-sulfur cluster assembly transcription factor
MVLSHTSENAVRAVLHIAAHQSTSAVRVTQIAAAMDVPQNYLSKTLHQLARAGVLHSARGPRGGFRLAMPPEQLTLQRIIETFRQEQAARRCLIGHGVCGETPTCLVHARWTPVVAELDAFFGTTTIADLLPDLPPSRGI